MSYNYTKCMKNNCILVLNMGKTWDIISRLKIIILKLSDTIKKLEHVCFYKTKNILIYKYFNISKNNYLPMSSNIYETKFTLIHSDIINQNSFRPNINHSNIHIYDCDYTYCGKIRSLRYNGYQFIICVEYNYLENIHIVLESYFIKIINKVKKYLVINFSCFI